jgi:hypothetical protein
VGATIQVNKKDQLNPLECLITLDGIKNPPMIERQVQKVFQT